MCFFETHTLAMHSLCSSKDITTKLMSGSGLLMLQTDLHQRSAARRMHPQVETVSASLYAVQSIQVLYKPSCCDTFCNPRFDYRVKAIAVLLDRVCAVSCVEIIRRNLDSSMPSPLCGLSALLLSHGIGRVTALSPNKRKCRLCVRY